MTASHPLLTMPSQFPKPALQVTPQTPLAQAAVPFVGEAQLLPHEPQCVASICRSVSQPFAATLSQSAHPESH